MIKGIFYIESQGNNEGAVKKSLHELVKKMQHEKGVTLKKTELGEALKDGNNFISNVELELEFETLRDFFRTSVRYVPYAIVLESPNKLSINSIEFLKLIGELTLVTKKFIEKQKIAMNVPEEARKKVQLKKNLLEKGQLSDDEIEALLDQGALRFKMVMQLKGDEKESLKTLLGAMGKEVFLHKVKASKNEDTTLVAVHGFMYEPKTFVDLAIKLSPVYMEILEPDNLMLSLLDIQDIGLELAAFYFEMAHITLNRAFPS
jgi:hypothetical protein